MLSARAHRPILEWLVLVAGHAHWYNSSHVGKALNVRDLLTMMPYNWPQTFGGDKSGYGNSTIVFNSDFGCDGKSTNCLGINLPTLVLSRQVTR